jgi:hypothetical protein
MIHFINTYNCGISITIMASLLVVVRTAKATITSPHPSLCLRRSLFSTCNSLDFVNRRTGVCFVLAPFHDSLHFHHKNFGRKKNCCVERYISSNHDCCTNGKPDVLPIVNNNSDEDVKSMRPRTAETDTSTTAYSTAIVWFQLVIDGTTSGKMYVDVKQGDYVFSILTKVKDLCVMVDLYQLEAFESTTSVEPFDTAITWDTSQSYGTSDAPLIVKVNFRVKKGMIHMLASYLFLV